MDKLPYRKCVGIIVFNNKGQVWLGKRLVEPASIMPDDTLWQFPQGGIDKNEAPLAAAARELYEETGISSVTLVGQTEHWLHYDLPSKLIGSALKGKYRGQKQKWFAYQFDGDETEIRINPAPDGNSPEFEEWQWCEIEKITQRIVEFKKDIYQQLIDHFKPTAIKIRNSHT